MKIYSPSITGSFAADITGGSFIVARSVTPIFYMSSAGNIGVGTSTPARSLVVAGEVEATTYYGDGSNLTGIGDAAFPYTGSAGILGNLVIDGTLEATEKSFNIAHPTQPGKRLIYGVLEGPEHAVYCRGKVDGGIINLPEEWTGLVDESTITVQLTPIGEFQSVYVSHVSDNKVYLKSEDHINCYYLVHGTRKDVEKLQTVREV